jgi:hypothetical protein
MKLTREQLKKIIQEELEEVKSQAWKGSVAGGGMITLGGVLSATGVGAVAGAPLMAVGGAVLAVDKLLQNHFISKLPFDEQGIVKLADTMVDQGESPEEIGKALAAKLEGVKGHFKFLESAIRDAEGSPSGKKAVTLALKTSGHLQPDVSDTATKISQKVTDIAGSIADAPGSAWKAGKKALGMAEQKRLTREQLKKIIIEELGAEGRGGMHPGPWIDYGTGKEIDPEDHLGRPYENLVNDLSDLIMRSIEEDGMDPAEARRAAAEAMDIELGVNR